MAEALLNGAPGRIEPPAVLRFGPFTLDCGRQELRRGEDVVPLRPKTFTLLEVLARRPGQVLSKAELLDAVWPAAVVTEDSLTQSIHDLRTALGADGASLVRTVARRGYRFDAQVLEPDARPETPAPQRRRAALLAFAGGTLAVVVLVLSLGLGLGWHRDDAGPPAPRLSVVVLPLEAESGSDGGAGFGDTLSADLTKDLGKYSGLVVITPESAFTYRGRQVDPRQVARELNVRYVVRGTLRRTGNDVRLDLALIDGQNGRQHWAEQLALDRANLAASLQEVSGAMSRALGVAMYRAEGKRAAELNASQVQADDLAMQGWAVWYRGVSRENVFEALRLFEQAVALDPDTLRGWAGIGLMNGVARGNGWAADPAAALEREREVLRQLERIDGDDLMTYLTRIQPYFLAENFEGLLQFSTRLVERFPNHPYGHHYQAVALMKLGRFDECVAPSLQAIRLGPRDTSLPAWRSVLAFCHFFAGRYAQASDEARLAAQANTALLGVQLQLAASLARNGQLDEARGIISELSKRRDWPPPAGLATVFSGSNPRLAEGRERFLTTMRELGVP